MGTSIQLNPLCLFARALGLWLRGRVHLISNQVGSVVRDKEGYVIFRHIAIDDRERKAGAILKIRFRFARGSAEVNKRLSLIPIPFIIGVPGFMSKVWMLEQGTCEFQGVYEWETAAAAEAYMRSFAIRLMKRRAIPETLSHEITAA